ncbi:dynein axonemal heavy chain 5-like [Parasteatoda tepidariorum]|uniref:dynein axonemal heavy chain 5-like n=1 Tax=Parasteatoda tepidariorum TaxID=114398 RepID=UPI0039BD31A0
MLKGDCIYFMKTDLDKDMMFGRFNADCMSDSAMTSAVVAPLRNVFFPAFQIGNDWKKNELDETKNKSLCMEAFNNFVTFIEDAEENLKHVVKFKGGEELDLSAVKDFEAAEKFVIFDEKVKAVEQVMVEWIRQIQEVIAESGLIRQEADNVGPLQELRYWREILYKLSSVVDFVRSDKFQRTVKVLEAAQSRVLKIWRKEDRKLTDKINEVRDNVKYLKDLEPLCQDLYRNDMDALSKMIPLLISRVRMIHAISRFYNTSEHITSFFTKVTNQIVIVCKNYITESGKVGLWTIPRDVAENRMKKCINLFNEYKKELNDAKRETSSEYGNRMFKFYLVPVLGSFDSFCSRLNTICELFDIIEEYSVLNTCCIEGIEAHSGKFNSLVGALKGKPHDLLDHRKTEFDTDYLEFKKQIQELNKNLQEFINKQFETIPIVHRSILHLKRFQDLKISALDTTSQYLNMFKAFEFEMDVISKIYKEKELKKGESMKPPFAEKILWARSLYIRIEKPMDLLKANNKSWLVNVLEVGYVVNYKEEM